MVLFFEFSNFRNNVNLLIVLSRRHNFESFHCIYVVYDVFLYKNINLVAKVRINSSNFGVISMSGESYFSSKISKYGECRILESMCFIFVQYYQKIGIVL